MQQGKNQYSPNSRGCCTKQSNSTKTKRYYGIDITIDNVTITTGAQEGLFSVISAYVGQSDEVIMFDPIFDTYARITKFNQGKCVRLKLLPNGNIDYKLYCKSY